MCWPRGYSIRSMTLSSPGTRQTCAHRRASRFRRSKRLGSLSRSMRVIRSRSADSSRGKSCAGRISYICRPTPRPTPMATPFSCSATPRRATSRIFFSITISIVNCHDSAFSAFSASSACSISAVSVRGSRRCRQSRHSVQCLRLSCGQRALSSGTLMACFSSKSLIFHVM